MSYTKQIVPPIITNNPISVQLLGICSALAVTNNMKTALTMSLAVTVVMVLASTIISAMRRHMPTAVRLIIQITIIASLVIIIDQFLRAWFFEISQSLSIFVSLIVTNCLVMGRTEGFALHNPVPDAIADAFGNALGYSLVLMTVAFVRELLGFGTLFDYPVLPTIENGGWFEPLTVMQKAPSAFFIIGLMIWAGTALPFKARSQPVVASGTST